MSEWYKTLDNDQWLKPDNTGKDEAITIYQTLGLISNMKVLDIPCGAGRIAIHLARIGLKMTCIDLRQAFVEKARNRFLHEGLNGDFFCMDMRKINFLDVFDCIYNWQGSFGYFNDKENFDFLRKLSLALKLKGRIIIDQPHRDYVINNLLGTYSVGNKIIKTEFNFKRNIRINKIYIKGRKKENISELRLYSKKEMKNMFLKCG
ncbi:MAG: class I SAM-dependent methyltransferase [Candidatus Thorarchaeota archaeon]